MKQNEKRITERPNMISAFDNPTPQQRAEAARESARFNRYLAETVHPGFGLLARRFEREAERLSELTD